MTNNDPHDTTLSELQFLTRLIKVLTHPYIFHTRDAEWTIYPPDYLAVVLWPHGPSHLLASRLSALNPEYASRTDYFVLDDKSNNMLAGDVPPVGRSTPLTYEEFEKALKAPESDSKV